MDQREALRDNKAHLALMEVLDHKDPLDHRGRQELAAMADQDPSSHQLALEALAAVDLEEEAAALEAQRSNKIGGT